MNVRLATARTVMVGPVLDADGVAKTNLAVAAILASKNGGNPAALDGSATLTHKQTGHYLLLLTANDISALGVLELSIDSTTDAMPIKALNVLTATAWDALHAASGGYVPSDLVFIHGTALTETAGQLAGSFVKFHDVAAPTATALSLPDAVPGAAGGGFIAGTNAATSVTTALTANITGNLSGSVGSVSGAVGSVTGLNIANGAAEANTTYIHGTALTETAGQLAGGFVKLFDVAAPTGTLLSIPDAVAGTAGGLSTSDQVDGIGTSSGAALSQDAGDDNYDGGISGVTSGTTKVGTQTGSYTSTSVADGVAHVMTHAGQVVDIVYLFQAGGGTSPVNIEWLGLMNPINDTLTFEVWDHVNVGWESLGTRAGQTSTTSFTPKTLVLYARHMGTSVAELGNVYLRLQSSEAYNHIARTDQVYLTYAVTSRTVGYAEGAVWVDTAGTAGSVDYVNGTADNPCPWANALVVAASLGLTRFHIANDVTVTLAAAFDDKTMYGDHYYLELSDESINDSAIVGATISQVGSAASHTVFEKCSFLGDASTGPGEFRLCGFNTPTGTPFVANGAGEYVFVDCFSLVAGSGTPYFDFTGTSSASGVNFRRWSGGTNVTLDSDNTLSLEVVTGGGQTVVTGGADVEIRGICRSLAVTVSASETVQFAGVTGPITITDNASSAPTINLYGVSSSLTDGTSSANDYTTSRTNYHGADVALNVTASGNVGIDWANVENPTTVVDLTQTDIQLVDTVTTYTGNTPQTGNNYTRIGAAGVSLTAVALANATSDAVIADAVWNAATAAYGSANSYGLLIETDLDATISSRSTLTQTQVTGGAYALNATASGNVGIDWANVENPTTAVDLTQTDIQLVDTVTTYTGNTKQTGNSYPIVSHATYGNAAIRTRGDLAWITASSVTVSDKTGFKLASDGLDLVTAWTTAITGNITGNLSGSVGSVGTGGIAAAAFATDAISAAALSAAATAEIADGVLIRAVQNVEDTADRHSLGAVVMIATNASASTTTLTAKKPSSDATFQTYTLTTDSAADPVTGVS